MSVVEKHADDQKQSLLEAFLSGDDGCDHADAHLSFHQHLIAGAVAGVTEHCLMFPLDTIKTRMQVTTCCSLHSSHGMSSTGVVATTRDLLRVEGIRKLFRGISAMALGAGPSHAVYFAAYEQVHALLGADRAGHHPLANAASGASATLIADALFTPMDTIKQRLQVKHSPYRSVGHAATQMIRHEGIRSLFASYPTTLLMNVPFSAIQFAVYHSCKVWTHSDDFAPGSRESIASHWVSGGMAGATAALITNPLDVVRTALQTQGLVGRTGSDRYRGIGHVVSEVWARGGFKGFMRGWAPRVMFHIPGVAVCWTSYEYCKDMFATHAHSHAH